MEWVLGPDYPSAVDAVHRMASAQPSDDEAAPPRPTPPTDSGRRQRRDARPDWCVSSAPVEVQRINGMDKAGPRQGASKPPGGMSPVPERYDVGESRVGRHASPGRVARA